MWFNTIFAIPSTTSTCSKEISNIRSASFTFSGEEISIKACDSPISGPR